MNVYDVIRELSGAGLTGEQMAAVASVFEKFERALRATTNNAARQARHREKYRDSDAVNRDSDAVTREINVPVTPVAPVDPSAMSLRDMLEQIRKAEAAQVVRQATVPTEEPQEAEEPNETKALEA